jgi:hypothetical protein
VIFHYIAGKVEAEVYLPHEFFEHGIALAGAEAKIAERLVGHLYFSLVSLNCVVMPK